MVLFRHLDDSTKVVKNFERRTPMRRPQVQVGPLRATWKTRLNSYSEVVITITHIKRHAHVAFYALRTHSVTPGAATVLSVAANSFPSELKPAQAPAPAAEPHNVDTMPTSVCHAL